MTDVDREVRRFERAAQKNVEPEHVAICVAAFRVGVECGVRKDVQGSEMDALESLVLAISKGFETGLRIRAGQSQPVVNILGSEQAIH